jgi:DNA (cytosine-5)-methyltransferase 1
MVTVAGHTFSLRAGSIAMGIDWMTRDELAEAIPPAFTEFVGRKLL